MNPNNDDCNDHLLNLSLAMQNSSNNEASTTVRSGINLPSTSTSSIFPMSTQAFNLPSTSSSIMFPMSPQFFIPCHNSTPVTDVSVGPARKKLPARQPSNQVLGPGKTEIIPQPYPWATNKRATIHTYQYLKAKDITTITGKIQCKRCGRQFEIAYDLKQKLAELEAFIMKKKDTMRHRAAEEWMNPRLPDCKFCHQRNCLKPVVSKKKSINWLFLLLGQMLGCCKLSELKYFCKHTRNHRTGAKDRVLYLTYFELWRQLHPT